MHFAKNGYSDCFYDLSYALERAQANKELRLWINVENAMIHGKGKEKGKGEEKGKSKKKGKGKEKGILAIYARAEGSSGGKGMKGSVTANHSRFGNMLGLGNDEEQFLMAMRKYKDQPLLDARAAEMKGWRNAS